MDEEDPEPKEEHEVCVHGEGVHPRREVDHADVDRGSGTSRELWGPNSSFILYQHTLLFIVVLVCVAFLDQLFCLYKRRYNLFQKAGGKFQIQLKCLIVPVSVKYLNQGWHFRPLKTKGWCQRLQGA